MRKAFNSTYGKAERRSLMGRSRINFWVIVTILSVTFVALGLSNGLLQRLEQTLSSPFVNWIPVNIPYGQSEQIRFLVEEWEAPEVRKRYQVQGFNLQANCSFRFWNPVDKQEAFARGRSIDRGDPLLAAILAPPNLVAGGNFYSDRSCGLLVTQQFLESFQYPLNSSHITWVNPSRSESGKIRDLHVPLPIVAVVREIPGNHDFMFTEFFYQASVMAHEDPFIPWKSSTLNFFVPNPKGEEWKSLKTKLKAELAGLPKVRFSESKAKAGYQDGVFVEVDPVDSTWTSTELDSVFGHWKTRFTGDFQEVRLNRTYAYDLDLSYGDQLKVYDELAIHFASLDSVGAFRKYLKTEYKDIDIDDARVKEKATFVLVSRLTLAGTTLLMLLAMVASAAFIFNLLSTHLRQMGSKIGTLIAFGIEGNAFQALYLRVVFSFLIRAAALSFAGAWSLGTVLEACTSLGFRTVHWNFLALTSLVLACGLGVVLMVTSSLFKKHPGDLVYGRHQEIFGGGESPSNWTGFSRGKGPMAPSPKPPNQPQLP